MKTTASNQGEPARKPLRAFILEDNPRDAKLMVAMLEREGYAVRYEVTDSQELFRDRLENGECDIILADFNLRNWDALDALEMLRQSGKDVPLIVVTGSLGDEGAVDCVKRGAADFVLKDRPARLPLAIKQALEDKRLRDEQTRAEGRLRESEASFRLLFAANPLPMWVYDVESLRFLEVNDAAVQYYGYTRDEFLQMLTTDIRPAGYVEFLSENLVQEKPILDSSGPWRHRLKDGQIIRVQITSHTLEWMGRRAMLVVAQDISERLRSEEALRESEERYRLLFERNLAGVFRMTLYGRVLHCNQAMAKMLGFGSPQEVLAHPFQDFYFSDEEHSRFVNELILVEWVTNFEMRMRRQDGTPLWVIANVSTKVEAPGHLRVTEGTLVDITDRKRAEEALREYEKALEGLEEMLAVVDRNYRYVLANRAFLNYRGMTREQLTGLGVRDLMGAELFDSVIKKQLDECFEGKVIRFELTFNYPKVGLRDLSASLFPIQGPGGVDRVAIIVQDITERKQAEEALKDSERRYRDFIQHSNEGVWRMELEQPIPIDLPGEEFMERYLRFAYLGECNRAYACGLGFSTPEEVVGKHLGDLFPPSDQERWESFRSAARRGLNDLTVEFRSRDKSGNLKHWLRTEIPIIQNGMLLRVWGITRDVTEVKQAEEALRHEKHLLHTVMDNVPDLIYFKDCEIRFTRINLALAREFGLGSPAEAVGKSDRDFFSAEQANVFYKQEREIITTGKPMVDKEEKLIWPDRHATWVSTTEMPLRDPGGAIVGTFGISRDITERKQAEEALRYEKDLLHTVMDNVPDLIYFKDRHSRFTRINVALALDCRLSSPAEAVGRSDYDFFSAEQAEGFYQDEQEIIRTGKPIVDKEEKVIWPSGQLTWMSTTKMPLRDPGGNIIGTFGISRNITARKRVEEEIRHLASFPTLNPQAVIEVDLDGRVCFRNDAARQFLPDSVQLATNHPFLTNWSAVVDACRRGVDLPVRTVPLGDRWYEQALHYVREIQRVRIYSLDVTDRKRAEAALHESEERFRSLFENATVGIYRTTPDGRVLMANPTLVRMLGFEQFEDLAKRNLETDGFQPDYSRRAFLERIDREGVVIGLEAAWGKQEGPVTFVRESARAIRAEDGRVMYYDGIVEDITDRKRAEDALRESEDKYRSIVLNIPEVVWTIDSQGRPVFVTPNVETLTGYTAEETCEGGLALMNDRLRPEDFAKMMQAVQATFRDKHLRDLEYRCRRKDGRWIWVRSRFTSAFEKEGVAYLQGLLSDVTEQKLAELALRDSETRYRTIFESAGDAILLSKEDIIVDCSARALDLFRCTRVQLIGQSVISLSPAFQPDGSRSNQTALETIQRVLSDEGFSFDWQFQRRDGTLFDAEVRLTRLQVSGEVYLIGVVRDVTEHRRTEKTLLRLRLAVNASGEVVFMTDPAGLFTFINPEFTRLYGYTEEGVLGKATPRILKSGIIDAPHYARFWESLLNKRVVRGEITNKTKDGQMVVVASSVNPVLNDRGETTGYLAIQRDRTERKRLEQQYLQAQKMEAVGRLAAGVAHDFNNLLTIINGYSDLLLERLPPDDNSREPVAEIKDAGQRATGLTRQLLAFSRQEIRTPRVLDLDALIADSLKMLRRLIGEDIELVFTAGSDVGTIKADPGQIEQVLMNLAVNARDAMPKGGKLTIETSNFLADEAYATSHFPMPPGSYVMLAVSDTGEGMDAETQARIFEPFFTTKGQGKGTGLGLATVYGIVKQSGGYAWVYSELGRGTAFKIYLPLSEGTPDAIMAAGSVAGGSETVLLVEDEAKLRALTRNILESRGYKVLEAQTSMEALLIPGRHKGPIHLLLTDVVMPVMSGREVAETLAKSHPQIKILYMSGYTDDTVVRHGVLESGTAFLQKPFSSDALARKVREVLDSQESSS